MKENKSYKELDAWKEARKLVKLLYELTDKLPDKEKFNLVTQMQRASVSIISNIAEGVGRHTKKDTAQFFFVARGSLYELETQVFVCIDLGYLSEKKCEAVFLQIEKTRKLVSGFINYLQRTN